MNAQVQPLVIEALAMLAKTWGGQDVRSEPEEGEEGGDAGDLVPGRELKFSGMVLTQDWMERLIGRGITAMLFNSVNGQRQGWAFPSFSKIPIDDKYKNCEVVITFGVSNNVVKIERATIKNIRCKRTKTNDVEMNCTVVGIRPRCMEVLDLEDFAGKPVTVRLEFGPVDHAAEGQQQLELAPAVSTTVDKTRVLAPGQADAEAETQRQLSEALRGLEQQDDAA
jgi:hypothetical protein